MAIFWGFCTVQIPGFNGEKSGFNDWSGGSPAFPFLLCHIKSHQ